MEQPKLKYIELLSDGWLKKYLMHYELPDGSEKTYDAISRKSPEGYLAELQRGDAPARIDAVSIVATSLTSSLHFCFWAFFVAPPNDDTRTAIRTPRMAITTRISASVNPLLAFFMSDPAFL